MPFSSPEPCALSHSRHDQTHMPTDKKVRVAIVGLGFGAEFIPIYQRHPNAEMYAICRRDRKELDAVGDRFGIGKRYTELRRAAEGSRTSTRSTSTRPIADHAPQSIAALKAGKHVASTVPMATTIDECRQIVEAQRKSGKVYMMMETVVYSREYLFVKELYDKGELGRIQFLRGSHQQDMDGWPGYWAGLAADALRDALRQPVPRDPRQARRERRLPRLRADSRGADSRSTAARSRSRPRRSRCATPTSRPR